jgi:hypothetical protein
MRILLLIAFSPLFSFAQYSHDFKPNEKLFFRTRVISDSGTFKGYFITAEDSTVILSSVNRYSNNTTVSIPVNTIKKLQIKNKSGINLLGIFAGSVFGFTLAAGLIQNDTDANYDGKTSFWELLFAAIEGTTSSDRRRRNTALIAGAAGGTALLVAGIFTTKKILFVFPINNRNNFYTQKKAEINNYIKF